MREVREGGGWMARMLAVIFCVALCSFLAGCDSPEANSPESIYNNATTASVEILVDGRIAGSGWFADRKGSVVTAAHVIGSHKDGIEIFQTDGQRRPVEVIAVDRVHDIALLQDPAANSVYPFLKIAEDMPSPGEAVYFYGLALYHHNIVLGGTVARKDVTFNYFTDRGMEMRAYHIAAPSPSGTSGGPWLDSRGRVIGNQSGFMTHKGVGAGIAVVAPPGAIRRLVKTRRSAITPTMGCGFEELWTQPRGFIRRFPKDMEGVISIPIRDGGPAHKAGLGKESLIVAIDGEEVRFRNDLHEAILAHKPGDVVVLRVMDPDNVTAREVRVELGQLD